MRLRWDLVALAYSLLAVIGAALSAFFHGANPALHPAPKLVLSVWERHSLSLGLGLVFGLFIVATARLTTRYWSWARKLHCDLRPVALGLGTPMIVLVAILSGLGEEMVFRSLLTPWVGVWAQAAIFGFLHQMRGSSRWIWALWAGAVGLGLGGLYWMTGSLLGPIAAHALINALNLMYLRARDFGPPDPALGGLLVAPLRDE